MKKILIAVLALISITTHATPRYAWGWKAGYEEVAPWILADNTAQVQAAIDNQTVLPAGNYNVTHLTLSHSFNPTGSTITCTSLNGAMFTITASNVSLTNGHFTGSGGTLVSNGLSCINLNNASNFTLNNCSITAFANYGITATNGLNIHVTNNTISNIGYLGVSIIQNSGLNTGVVVSGNIINRTAQPASTIPQSALIVRSFAPGVISGAVVSNNTITMPLHPTVDAAECFEVRNCINSRIYNNIFTNGTIGLSIVGGCTGTQAYNNTFIGQNLEAMELGESPHSSVKNSVVSSGHIGVLVDGNIGALADTIQNISISGLTGSNPYPIEVNVNTATLLDLLITGCTINTTTRAISIENSSGVTINNTTASGNNTTYAIFWVKSIGNTTINNSVFTGFTPKIGFATISSGTITVNNIIGTAVAPTGGTFLGLGTFGAVTLGSNISWNAGPALPIPLYSPNNYSYFINAPISTVTPSNSGGAATLWHISPTQPSGLNFSTSDGSLSGTALALSASTTYTVTASNVSGASTTPLTIRVIDHPPILSYPVNTQVTTIGVPMTPMTASNSGGAVISYTVNPALPPGITLVNGVISGTGTSLSPVTTYTVQGFNSGGSSSTPVTLSVVNPAPAVPNISYSPNTYIFPVNSVIVPTTPVNTGGFSNTFSISPSLPASLSFSITDGTISGIPTVLSGAVTYDVSASNVSGTSHAPITISVANVPPALPSFTYSPNNITLTINQSGLLISPSSTGGVVATYSVTPALPSSLVLDASTGIISGVGTALSSPTVYTVTGTNVTGQGHYDLTISVVPQSGGVVIRISGFVARFN